MKPILFFVLFFVSHSTLIGQEYAKVIESHTKYTINNGRSAEIRESYSILILSEKGLRFSVIQEYIDKFRSVRSIEITIKDSAGKKVKKLTKGNGRIIGFGPSYEVSDGKILLLDPEYQHYPFTIEINSVIEYNGFISLPAWVPRYYFNLSVQKSTFEIITPEDVGIRIREEKTKPVEDIVAQGKRIIKYEAQSMPPINTAMRYKDFYNDQLKVYIVPIHFELDHIKGSYDTWSTFGDWFLKLNTEPYELSDYTKSFLGGLSYEDKRRKVIEIFRYMQSRTRYVSIQLGIGGFKSLPVQLVDSKGYGDCKALTTYMKSMLDFVGIESNYILVRAGNDEPDVMKELPMNQFNHVFLGVPIERDTILLECTSQVSPPDYVGTFTDDRNVLWISGGNSKIIRSRVYNKEDNIQVNKASISIDEDGDALIQIVTTERGVFFADYFIYTGAPEDYIKRFNNNKFSYKDFVIKNFKFERPGVDQSELHTSYFIEAKALAKHISDKIILPSNMLKATASYIDFDDYSKYANVLRSITIEDSVVLNINNNFWTNKLPDDVTISNRFGDFELKYSLDSDQIVLQRRFTFTKGLYLNADYEAFSMYLKKIKELELKSLVLYTKT